VGVTAGLGLGQENLNWVNRKKVTAKRKSRLVEGQGGGMGPLLGACVLLSSHRSHDTLLFLQKFTLSTKCCSLLPGFSLSNTEILLVPYLSCGVLFIHETNWLVNILPISLVKSFL
jgi:hypothetical protein